MHKVPEIRVHIFGLVCQPCSNNVGSILPLAMEWCFFFYATGASDRCDLLMLMIRSLSTPNYGAPKGWESQARWKSNEHICVLASTHTIDDICVYLCTYIYI